MKNYVWMSYHVHLKNRDRDRDLYPICASSFEVSSLGVTFYDDNKMPVGFVPMDNISAIGYSDDENDYVSIKNKEKRSVINEEVRKNDVRNEGMKNQFDNWMKDD